jgi:hypothetical protein
MTLTDQEIEELRIAIAECVGWKYARIDKGSCGGWVCEHIWFKPGFEPHEQTADWIAVNGKVNPPPYTTSIDSIREAAMERFKLFADSMEFNAQLGIRASELANTIGLSQWKWQLTALDWCIAFARTAKIWRFKV